MHSVQCGPHRVEIEEVPKHRLSAKLLQLLRSLVRPMGEYPHRVVFFKELACCVAARGARGARNQEFRLCHFSSP